MEQGVAPGTTGRFLVLLSEDETRAGASGLRRAAGMTVAAASDSADPIAAPPAGAEALLFEELGVAVIEAPPDQLGAMGAMAADAGSGVLAIEPERIVYAIGEAAVIEEVAATAPTTDGWSVEYLRGYRDGVDLLIGKVLPPNGAPAPVAPDVEAASEARVTWGLTATKVPASKFSGKGIRVAVLDTGLDLGHPDFAERTVVSESFIPGEAAQDGHGHGTHCVGTACGPKRPGQLPRYGVAYGTEIYAGKVLSNGGSGADGGILAGIRWAIRNGCAVVSMSLGAPVLPGQRFNGVFEFAARRALDRGTLIVAAAGNDSARPSSVQPVSHPANCPSIMAVAAIDPGFGVAPFSNGGINAEGGRVDIAAPGVRVRSSWPRPVLYRTINGTSMATPHVAGIAALLAEANPRSRGTALGDLLVRTVRQLGSPAQDVGAGLVQAP